MVSGVVRDYMPMPFWCLNIRQSKRLCSASAEELSFTPNIDRCVLPPTSNMNILGALGGDMRNNVTSSLAKRFMEKVFG
jgi:hypothetical protein